MPTTGEFFALLIVAVVAYYGYRYLYAWRQIARMQALASYAGIDIGTLQEHIQRETLRDFGILVAAKLREHALLLLRRTERAVDELNDAHELTADEVTEFSLLIVGTHQSLLRSEGLHTTGLICHEEKLGSPVAQDTLRPLAREWSLHHGAMKELEYFVGTYLRGGGR